MSLSRRGFLQFLGAAVAGTALPIEFAEAKVAKAPAWANKVVRFHCAKLSAGKYTFSAYVRMAGDTTWSLYVAAVKATGGETVFEVPYSGDHVELINAQLSTDAITYQPRPYEERMVPVTELNRGKPHSNIVPCYRQFEKRKRA